MSTTTNAPSSSSNAAAELLIPCLAEAIGAFTLSFIGVLAIVGVTIVSAPAGTTNLTAIALAHGLAIGVMVAALGAISGGHFNPAVTLGFVVSGRMSIVKGIAYWIAQLIGATIAGLILVGLFGAATIGGGVPDLAQGVSPTAGIVLEALGTFFLVLVVFGTAVDERAPKYIYPFAIGLTISIDIMAFGPITGAAVNPSRSFGPALASGHWENQMVYWIGPLIGGAVAGLLQHFVLMQRKALA